MDVREKLVELLKEMGKREREEGGVTWYDVADHLIAHGVTVQDNTEISDELLKQLRSAPVMAMTEEPTVEVVQEWISSEEKLPEFPCLALDVNGNSVFIPDGILTIKDNHGEWCIDASLAKEVRLVDGTKIDVLLWENRIAYWMPLPQPPKGE